MPQTGKVNTNAHTPLFLTHPNHSSYSKIKDFSCEIDIPIQYLEYIRDFITDKKNQDDCGHLDLSPNQIQTFAWMLLEAGNIVGEINTALYSRNKIKTPIN
jgi:hypothetical protein